jgi:diadenosine tetraphosphatase ApaH/serine/threonine PP2A family protein phosphatase
MRCAVLSDIHGNLEAFRAVLTRIADLGVERMVCLGDLVGYNANPNECVDIVRNEGIISVLGNHDSRACGMEQPDNFNATAARAVLWTRDRLTDENRAFLAALPRELPLEDAFLCHGSIHDTDRYILFPNDVRDNFSLLVTLPGRPHICFFGHTHIPSAYSSEGTEIRQEPEGTVMIADGRQHLINPGAVGQPRDGDPRAAFAVYDAADGTVTFHRVAYDIPAAQDKLIRAGLPPGLAERLAYGR